MSSLRFSFGRAFRWQNNGHGFIKRGTHITKGMYRLNTLKIVLDRSVCHIYFNLNKKNCSISLTGLDPLPFLEQFLLERKYYVCKISNSGLTILPVSALKSSSVPNNCLDNSLHYEGERTLCT